METFCGYCNQTFEHGWDKCPNCGRKTAPLTEAHKPKKGEELLLLSGTAAARVGDPYVYTREDLEKDLEDDPVTTEDDVA